MTAFLFIPSGNAGASRAIGRRVDFANIASLFAEADEPLPRPATGRFARIGLVILVLLGIFGDALLIARPAAMAEALSAAHPAQVAARTSL